MQVAQRVQVLQDSVTTDREYQKKVRAAAAALVALGLPTAAQRYRPNPAHGWRMAEGLAARWCAQASMKGRLDMDMDFGGASMFQP